MRDSTEQAQLATALRGLADTYTGMELTQALTDFGFDDLVAEMPMDGISLLFNAMGEAGSSCGVLSDVLTGSLATSTGTKLSGLAVLLPPIGHDLAGSIVEGQLSVRGLILGPHTSSGLLAAVSSPDGVSWVRVDEQPKLWKRSIRGLDSALNLEERNGSGLSYEVVYTGDAAANGWDLALAAGRCALGYQLLGAGSMMLRLATAHAVERVQFGRAVGSFQAVRHRLADALVAMEAAAAVLEMSWSADDPVLAAMLAKSLAGSAARVAGSHCQQVLAGIGFTAEHPFHAYLNRVTVLDQLLGSATDLPQMIGTCIAAAGAIPRLAQL